MSINDKLDSVVMKRADDSVIMTEEDDDFARPERPARDADDLDMDITPMIDITFLLLIFFLVSSTPDQSTPIKLPQAKHGSSVSQRFSTMIYVGQGGIDSAPVFKGDANNPTEEFSRDAERREEQIGEYIRAGLAEDKLDVVIKADRTVPCGSIDGVLKAVSKVEKIKLHLGVLEPNS
ncbi:ExbD/TolR family protein [Aeoliella mucimassa]|uniref:Biopolymer transport protein ExbD/TolR n=1 Tax=Aeoliella mucimassa TaxID=2527972 RepID=A0A518AP56_9BACT|nr:biopolymer transporter ExbD [Aeoliella mucimassa]QDU56506.1 Biopolymer transport protein ExbD/TolR [Aeoliella mucimassa]